MLDYVEFPCCRLCEVRTVSSANLPWLENTGLDKFMFKWEGSFNASTCRLQRTHENAVCIPIYVTQYRLIFPNVSTVIGRLRCWLRRMWCKEKTESLHNLN
jgi:hypothetical protein